MASRPLRHGGRARSGTLCIACPLRTACTKPRAGRVISIHPHESVLQRAKTRQRDPDWQQGPYRRNRPTVECKISHFTRRPWGGRKARCRGQARILTDVLTRASVINLARPAALGLHHTPDGWTIALGPESPGAVRRRPHGLSSSRGSA